MVELGRFTPPCNTPNFHYELTGLLEAWARDHGVRIEKLHVEWSFDPENLEPEIVRIHVESASSFVTHPVAGE